MAQTDDSERQQVEVVFGLLGGELNDKPFAGFRYNYDGLPEWAARDYDDRFQAEYRTVIGCFLYGAPPEELRPGDGSIWRRQATYSSSGEAECLLRDADDANVLDSACVLCDANPGEEHGVVYIGDGFAEVVYRRRPDVGDQIRIAWEKFVDAIDDRDIRDEVHDLPDESDAYYYAVFRRVNDSEVEVVRLAGPMLPDYFEGAPSDRLVVAIPASNDLTKSDLRDFDVETESAWWERADWSNDEEDAAT